MVNPLHLEDSVYCSVCRTTVSVPTACVLYSAHISRMRLASHKRLRATGSLEPLNRHISTPLSYRDVGFLRGPTRSRAQRKSDSFVPSVGITLSPRSIGNDAAHHVEVRI